LSERCFGFLKVLRYAISIFWLGLGPTLLEAIYVRFDYPSLHAEVPVRPV
jgi:hypothetical protein